MNDEPTERFVDEPVKPIPPADTWELLTVNQLIDVKSELQNSAYAMRKNPMIANALNQGIAKISRMINERSKI